jgi:hypothetical protein
MVRFAFSSPRSSVRDQAYLRAHIRVAGPSLSVRLYTVALTELGQENELGVSCD